MAIDKLRYFLMVAQTGSVRRAAELLRLSPSALSRAVKQLESEWGVQLFAPSGRGIAITDAGRALQQRAARVVSEYDAFVSEAGRPEPEEHLRVGSFEIFTTYFLAWAIDRYFPTRPVLVREVIPGEIERALLNLEIDVGITYAPVPEEGLDFLKVATQEMRIFGQPAKLARVPFSQLPFAVPTSRVSGGAVGVRGLDGWPLTAPGRSIRYQCQMLETALALASAGRSVLFCPPFLVGLYNEAVQPERRLEPLPHPPRMRPVKLDIYLVKRKSTLEERDFKLIARAVRERCRR